MLCVKNQLRRAVSRWHKTSRQYRLRNCRIHHINFKYISLNCSLLHFGVSLFSASHCYILLIPFMCFHPSVVLHRPGVRWSFFLLFILFTVCHRQRNKVITWMMGLCDESFLWNRRLVVCLFRYYRFSCISSFTLFFFSSLVAEAFCRLGCA